MKRQWILAVAAVGCLAPASMQAQAPAGNERVATLERTPSGQAAASRRTVLDAVETRVTPDRPYAAEAVTETVQVLGDGNRISRTAVTKVYRDGAGRTRREMLAEDGTVRAITITDPVAHVSYSLDPATKVAYKRGASLFAVTRSAGGRGGRVELGSPTRSPAGAGGGGATSVGQSTRVVSGTPLGRMRSTPGANVQKEELPPQNIEGVMAAGTRTTTTIPAGEIGNAQEIRIVSEQWFTDDLQVLVMTRHSDPRSGETTYRLRNILRAEPDPSLFAVPADYTLREGNVRREQ